MNKKEKEYIFYTSEGINHEEKYILKESELDKRHKNLLLGNIINEFNKLPDDTKSDFINRVTSTIDKIKEQQLYNNIQLYLWEKEIEKGNLLDNFSYKELLTIEQIKEKYGI